MRLHLFSRLKEDELSSQQRLLSDSPTMSSHRESPSSLVRLLGVFLILQACLVQGKKSDACREADNCILPYCACDLYSIPGNLNKADIPQMVILTYQGYLDEDVFELIYQQIWVPKFINPDGCRSGMTLFVPYEASNNCSIHKLYTVGYEIAMTANNKTVNIWENDYLDVHRENLTKESHLDVDHVQGFRSQKDSLPLGSDWQYKALHDNGFSYDSSFLYVPKSQTQDTPWPFTLDLTIDELEFEPDNLKSAPSQRYAGLWEVPIVRLVGNQGHCTLLRDCMGGMQTVKNVEDLLLEMLEGHRKSNKAPMMINLDFKTLKNTRIMTGLQNFFRTILHGDIEDVWVVSIQQMLEWRRTPVSKKHLQYREYVDICLKTHKYRRCDKKNLRKPRATSNFRVFMDVDVLYIYQIVVLVIFYVALLRYDKMQGGVK